MIFSIILGVVAGISSTVLTDIAACAGGAAIAGAVISSGVRSKKEEENAQYLEYVKSQAAKDLREKNKKDSAEIEGAENECREVIGNACFGNVQAVLETAVKSGHITQKEAESMIEDYKKQA